MDDNEQKPEKLVTQETLDLKLKALRSDLRLMIIASVALNQFLTNVSLPDGLSTAAIAAAIFAPAIKAVGSSVLGR